MFVRKPLFLLEGDDEPGGGAPDDAPEPNPDTAPEDSQPEPAEDPDGEGQEPFDAARALAKIKKVNSENAALRKAKKAAEDKAQGLEPAARDAALQRVARRLGLPDNEQVDAFLTRLQGETVDELAEDAEKLLALLAPKDEPKSTERKPTQALRGGGDPDTEPAVDNRKLAEDILAGF